VKDKPAEGALTPGDRVREASTGYFYLNLLYMGAVVNGPENVLSIDLHAKMLSSRELG
jgi:hypothetical protein